MESAIQFNFGGSSNVEVNPSFNGNTSNTGTITDSFNILSKGILIDIPRNLSRKIINNNNSNNIIINHVIDYNIIINSFFERTVIDMNAAIQLEINKIVTLQRNIHLSLFVVSSIIVILSWATGLFSEDISIVLKPLSITFSLMIILNYYFRRIK